MLHNSFIASCLVGILALVTAGFCWAAVPMNVIKGWQSSAPEALEITILEAAETSETRPYNAMRPDGSVTTTKVRLTAQVDVVRRSAGGVRPGDVIVVSYTVRRYSPVSPPDGNYGVMLKKGETATAYLKPIGNKTFQPAGDVGCLGKL